MNCLLCSQEIAMPAMTGELCTSCYFKKDSIPSVVLKEAKEAEPTSAIEPSLPTETNQPALPIAKEFTAIADAIQKMEPEEDVPFLPSKPNLDPSIKYCQSCIERNYSPPKQATREWKENYFLCDDCFGPLINNILNFNSGNIQKAKEIPKESTPFLEKMYDVLEIPSTLRFTQTDHILRNREEIYNHHAPAIINLELTDAITRLEDNSVILMQIKLHNEHLEVYISKEKEKERIKNGVARQEEEKEKFTRPKRSKEHSAAKTMFPFMSEADAIAKYLEISKAAKTAEFKKIVGS